MFSYFIEPNFIEKFYGKSVFFKLRLHDRFGEMENSILDAILKR